MAININLYPPIVSTYLPAFLADPGICKMYLSISQYNSFESIKNVQVTIKNQNSNLSVLNAEKYPCEVMLKTLQQEGNKYYIDITKEDIDGGEFELNQYYKVQVRFTSIDASSVSLTPPQAIDSWLAANQNYFSEWSSICLIRAISTPDLEIVGWDIINNQLAWSNANNTLTGKLVFADENESDSLKSYRVVLKDDVGNILTDSGILYSDTFTNDNTFEYVFKYNFEVDNFYSYEIEYTTMNLYTSSTALEFFQVIQESDIDVTADILTTPEPELGCITVSIVKQNDGTKFTGDICIRRMAIDENIWEDLQFYTYNAVYEINDNWNDYSVESGVEYQYCIQAIDNTTNNRGGIVLSEPTMVIFDNMFLTTANINLCIKYNPSVSSFKRTLAESKIDTIGAQYPFFRRNGYTNYAQFPIGGLIVAEDNTTFLNIVESSLISSNQNKMSFSAAARSFITERKYRKEILDFLQADTIKLFRSTPEGNILIKLMDVSLTPQTALGRKIWSFTATAYEIDSCSVDNYLKYNIIQNNKKVIGEEPIILYYTNAQVDALLAKKADKAKSLDEYTITNSYTIAETNEKLTILNNTIDTKIDADSIADGGTWG